MSKVAPHAPEPRVARLRLRERRWREEGASKDQLFASGLPDGVTVGGEGLDLGDERAEPAHRLLLRQRLQPWVHPVAAEGRREGERESGRLRLMRSHA